MTVGWSGAINPPTGTTDVLAVSNGVIQPSKANLGVSKSLDYEVRPLRFDSGPNCDLSNCSAGLLVPGRGSPLCSPAPNRSFICSAVTGVGRLATDQLTDVERALMTFVGLAR